MTIDPDATQPQLPTVWLRKEALAWGFHDRAIAQRVRAGEWHRVRRGAYCSQTEWQLLDRSLQYAVLVHAVVKQAKTKVVVSHASALPFHAAPTWGVPLDVVHLTRPDQHGGRKERGVHQHVGALAVGDVVQVGGLAVTSPTRTALDLTTQCGLDVDVVVLDDLLHRGLTTPEMLRDRYSTMSCWPGTLRTDLALRLMDGRAASVGESRIRLICWRQHLPAPTPQVPVRDHTGQVVAWLDLAWPALGVFLEFDGRIKYELYRRPGETSLDVLLREKDRQQMIVELTGWRPVRVKWADLDDPRRTAQRIERQLFPHGRAT